MREPRRYFRKADLLKRYGWRSKISVDRGVKAGTLPPPDTYMGPIPLWLEGTLDKRDQERRRQPPRRRARVRSLKPSPVSPFTRTPMLIR